MPALKNHPGAWLAGDAAAAFNAMEDKHGVIVLNRAGVTVQQQQALIDRWDSGDRAGLYPPARPASSSNHVSGEAVDIYNYTDDRAKLEEFGFQWYGMSDPVHYTFTGWNPPAEQKETEDMLVHIQGRGGVRSGGLYYLTGNTAKFIGGDDKTVPHLNFDQGTALLNGMTVK